MTDKTFSSEIMERVWEFITGHGLFTGKEKNILVGLSGGADSVCLLFMLKKFKCMERLGKTEILAAHLNHGIRGEEAGRDEEFVKDLCEKLSVELFCKTLDIPALAIESNEGEEETGRRYRYSFFREVLEARGGGVIATAHHKNDLAETVLINLARGTGLTGLAGIKAKNKEIVRPLLCITRKEIERYNGDNDLDYVTDSTNEQDIYTRNYLRNNVIPLIEANVNPGLIQHIYSMSDIALRADEYLEEQAGKLFGKCSEDSGHISIPVKSLSDEKKIVREYFYRLCFKKLKGSIKDLPAERINETDRLLTDTAEGKRKGKTIELGRGVTVFSEGDGLCFSSSGENEEEHTENRDVYIPLFTENVRKDLESGKTLRLFADNIEVVLKLAEKFVKNNDTDYTKYFDYGKISDTACLRYADEDDFIVVTASGDRHSLKQELKNRKIPAAERKNVLVLARENECLWAVGIRRGMSLPVTEKNRILEVTVTTYFGGFYE